MSPAGPQPTPAPSMPVPAPSADDPVSRVARARKLCGERRVEEAFAALFDLAGAFGNDPAFQAVMGVLALRLGRTLESENYLRTALRLDPCIDEALSVLADLLEKEGRNPEEVSRLRWKLVSLRGRSGDDDGLRRAISALAGLRERSATQAPAPGILPPDQPFRLDSPLRHRYEVKETRIVPQDFQYRYAHHDYRLLTAYHGRLGRRVLHLGCNAGINSIILARNGFEVHGVDVQAEAIGIAMALRDREPEEVRRRVTFQCSSFDSMDLPAGGFDSAIAFDVFEHIYPEDFERVAAIVAAALREGGFLLAHMPRLDCYQDPAHVNRWDLPSVRESFGRRFRVLRCFVTQEDDVVPGSQRVNLLAQKGPEAACGFETDELADLERRIPVFSSNQFNEHYTRDRALGRLSALADAARAGSPFDMIRLGDIEVRLLAFGRVPLGLPNPIREAREIERHLGVNPAALSRTELRALQDDLFRYCTSADILGTHRGTINVEWARDTEVAFRHFDVREECLPNEVDVCFNAELLDQGYLLPILSRGRVLLVGNAAPRFAGLLADAGYRNAYSRVGMPAEAPRIAGAVHVPHDGTAAYDRLQDLWHEVASFDFDTALVSASLVGKILTGRIKEQLGALVLDVGWNMQYLADVPSPVATTRDPVSLGKRRGFRNLFQGRVGGDPYA